MGPTVWVSPKVLANHQLASDIQCVTGFARSAIRNINLFCQFFLTFCWTGPYTIWCITEVQQGSGAYMSWARLHLSTLCMYRRIIPEWNTIRSSFLLQPRSDIWHTSLSINLLAVADRSHACGIFCHHFLLDGMFLALQKDHFSKGTFCSDFVKSGSEIRYLFLAEIWSFVYLFCFILL